MAELAINGGPQAKRTPYGSGQRFGKAEEDAAVAAIRSQQLWYIGGTRVLEAERTISRVYGACHAVCCSSGTAAVHTALAVCGVEAGDEVILNPVTDWGSALGILALGAAPVFADIDEETFSLDPACVERAITPRTRAILVVHVHGFPARIKEVVELARRRGLAVVEDCAQSHGAFVDGKAVGTFGTVGAYSTNDSKLVSCGEGGFVITDDERLARMARLFTDKGYDRTNYIRGAAGVPFMAFNYRMSELAAAVLDVQVRGMMERVHARRRYFRRLMARLEGVRGYLPLRPLPGAEASHWTILGRLDLSQFKADLGTIIRAVGAEGVHAWSGIASSRTLYCCTVFQRRSLWPMDPGRAAEWLPAGMYHEGLCPVAERVVDTSFILSNSEYYTDADADESADGVLKVLDYYRR